MTWHGITDIGLRTIAPDAFDTLDLVAAQVDGAGNQGLVELTRRHIRTLLGASDRDVHGSGLLSDEKATALAGWPSAAGPSATERVCVEMTEQFVLDVGSTTPAQRGALSAALGTDAFAYVQVLYALDWGIRIRLALTQLFGVEPQASRVTGNGATTLWSALEEFMRVVARMGALDPLTSELVRLRGARAHDCRVCKSRRNVVVIEAGADESMFDKIDWYESSDLSERHKIALRLTDAMIWHPAAYPGDLPSDVRTAFGPEEALEIVLDVSRNAANKIAVALGADQPNVADGIEYFNTDEGGELILGVSPAMPSGWLERPTAGSDSPFRAR